MDDRPNIFGAPVLWRYTMRSPRLTMFDARLVFFAGLPILHFRIWTVLLFVVALVVFWLIERAGYRLPSALRALRSSLAGSARPAMPRSFYRPAVTTAFEGHPLLPQPRVKAAAKTMAEKVDQSTKARRKPKRSRSKTDSAEPSAFPAE